MRRKMAGGYDLNAVGALLGGLSQRDAGPRRCEKLACASPYTSASGARPTDWQNVSVALGALWERHWETDGMLGVAGLASSVCTVVVVVCFA